MKTKPIPSVALSAGVNTVLLKKRKGVFRDGYTSEDVDRVLGDVQDATGIDLAIIWDIHDECGYHGNSDFAVYHGGKLHEITSGIEALSAFLCGCGSCPRSLNLRLGAVIKYRTKNGSNYAWRDPVISPE